MFIDSWPLNLFGILSLVTIAFAAAAYGIGEFLDHRSQTRHPNTDATSDSSHTRGGRS